MPESVTEAESGEPAVRRTQSPPSSPNAPDGSVYRYAEDDHAGQRFQVIPAAYVILRRGRQILLQIRQNTGYMDGHWACAVAGHVEAGESVLAAARREAREEMGIDLNELLAVTALHRTLKGGGPIEQRVDFFFQCSHWTGDPSIQEPEKAAEVRWFDLGSLPDALVPHERFVIEGLRDGGISAVSTFGFDE